MEHGVLKDQRLLDLDLAFGFEATIFAGAVPTPMIWEKKTAKIMVNINQKIKSDKVTLVLPMPIKIS